MRKLLIFCFIILTVTLIGCEKNSEQQVTENEALPVEESGFAGQDVYYAKYLRIGFYDQALNFKKYAYFGEKLHYLGKSITNKKKGIYHLVKIFDTGDEGYVKSDNIIANPKEIGVILENATLSVKPDLAIGKKTEVTAPILVYVMDIYDTDTTWAKIYPYYAKYSVYLESKTASKSYEYVVYNKISTRYEDIKVTIGILNAMAELKEANNSESARLILEGIIEAYPNSGAINHAQAALQAIESLEPESESNESTISEGDTISASNLIAQ